MELRNKSGRRKLKKFQWQKRVEDYNKGIGTRMEWHVGNPDGKVHLFIDGEEVDLTK